MGLHVARRPFLLGLGCLACRQRTAPLPKLGAVPSFVLTDQGGRPFSRASLEGKVWVAAFMFTRCPTVCPRITRRMKELQQQAKRGGVPLELLSFSVDPDYDTPKVLEEYARSFGLDLGSWTFVTGDPTVIKNTAVVGFKMALEGRFDAAAPEGGILHGSHLVLIDGAAEIRGFYRTDDAAELTRLLQDAKGLH